MIRMLRAASIAAAVLAAGLLVAGPRVEAQTAPANGTSAAASLPPPRVWLVDNKEGLVTVREKDGPYLFAQVATTPRLTIELNFVSKTKQPQVTLKDEKGKQLWQGRLPYVDHGDMQMQFTNTTGVTLTITPRTDTPSPTAHKTDQMKAELVLGADDALTSGRFTDGDNLTLIKREGTLLTMTQFEDGKQTDQTTLDVNPDKGTIVGRVNGKEIMALRAAIGMKDNADTGPTVIRDVKGPIAIKKIQSKGKTWTEFTIGDRKVLIEGSDLNCELTDGDLFIHKTTPSTDPPTKP